MIHGTSELAGWVRELDMLYNSFLLTALPIIALTWGFTRKKVPWGIADLSVLIFVPWIWIAFSLHLNDHKSLMNLGIEPYILGIGVGLIFIRGAFVRNQNRRQRLVYLIVSSLALVLAVNLLIPSLPE